MNIVEKCVVVCRHDRPIRFAIGHVLKKTHLCKCFKVQMDGYILQFQPSSLSASLWINPDDRKNDSDFLRAYLRPSDVYIDVGANIGNTVITAWLSVGTTGLVMAFEGHPRTCRFLENNLRLNGIADIKVVNAALGRENTSVSMTSLTSDDQNRVANYESGVRTQMYPLDLFTQRLESVDLLKIDVEGYEKFVLEGAKATLEKTRCVYIEISEAHFRSFGYGVSDVFEILHGAGFGQFRRIKDKEITRVDHSYLSTVRDENIVGIRDVAEFLGRTGWTYR